MNAAQYLAQWNISVAEARQFIVNNLDNIQNIYNAAKSHGITNEMLAEIYGGVTAGDVRNFFSSNGLNGAALDGNSDATSAKVLSDSFADQLAATAVGQTSSQFMAQLSAALKTGGADLDLDGIQEFGNEASIYSGSTGESATILNFMTQFGGRLSSADSSNFVSKAQAVMNLADKLVNDGGPSAINGIYSTPEMQAYYKTINEIAHSSEWVSPESPDTIAQALLTGIKEAYALYVEYDFVLFL